jgi:NifU-like protein
VNVKKSDHSEEIVCFCLKVSEKDLIKAIRSHKITSIDDITHHTKAGDGCTACHPVLKKLLAQEGY